VVVIAMTLTLLVRPLRDNGTFLLFLSAVVVTTYAAGRRAAVWAVGLSTLASTYFLLYPSPRPVEVDSFDVLARIVAFVVVSLMLIWMHATRSWAQRDALMKEEQLSLLMDTAHVGVWSYDLLTHEFWWSDSLKVTAGLSIRDDAPPYLGVLDVCHPEDKGVLSRAMTEAGPDGQDQSFEHRIIRRSPDRAVRRIHTIVRTFRDATGHPERITAITVDVTDYRTTIT